MINEIFLLLPFFSRKEALDHFVLLGSNGGNFDSGSNSVLGLFLLCRGICATCLIAVSPVGERQEIGCFPWAHMVYFGMFGFVGSRRLVMMLMFVSDNAVLLNVWKSPERLVGAQLLLSHVW